jgi:prophage regulatory protein
MEKDKLIKMKDVMDRIPLSRPSIYRLVKEEKFPKYIKIGGGTFWLESDINSWIQNQKTA